MSTNYQRGFALENTLVKRFTKLGWYATRTAGSHTIADVITIAPNGIVTMYQCKTTINSSFNLTDLFNDVSVFKLRQLPENIRKVLVVKLGLKHNSRIFSYTWSQDKQEWIESDLI